MARAFCCQSPCLRYATKIGGASSAPLQATAPIPGCAIPSCHGVKRCPFRAATPWAARCFLLQCGSCVCTTCKLPHGTGVAACNGWRHVWAAHLANSFNCARPVGQWACSRHGRRAHMQNFRGEEAGALKRHTFRLMSAATGFGFRSACGRKKNPTSGSNAPGMQMLKVSAQHLLLSWSLLRATGVQGLRIVGATLPC